MTEGLHSEPATNWGVDEPESDILHAEAIELALTVTDPELVAELAVHAEGDDRHQFALTALRIGILALKQAQGRVDADAIRREGERLVAGLELQLAEHRQAVTLNVANSLKEYFDPDGGRFNERVERLVRKDGELEQLLHRQIGLDDSELARTLATHFGESSPLMQMLSPEASKGLLASLRQTLEESLRAQREGILREFSLDSKESALSRLVNELGERHGKLTENLQGSIKEVVGEFSLDNEDSALSRLVRQVECAQKQISSEFSLDTDTSALARMKRELLDVLNTYKQESTLFQREVREALVSMAARKEAAQRTTTHGAEFETQVYHFLQDACQKAGDIATHSGNTTGMIKNCKIGDVVVELGPERIAAGARIVIEAKESEGYSLAKAREEIEVGRKNRGAEVGLFVFSGRTAPSGLEPLARYGNDVIAVWDAEETTSDVYLSAAVSVARALCTRAATQRDAQQADFESIDRAIRDIEKQVLGLVEIARLTETIKGNSDKILKRARIVQETLQRQVDLLDDRIGDLKSTLNEAG